MVPLEWSRRYRLSQVSWKLFFNTSAKMSISHVGLGSRAGGLRGSILWACVRCLSAPLMMATGKSLGPISGIRSYTWNQRHPWKPEELSDIDRLDFILAWQYQANLIRFLKNENECLSTYELKFLETHLYILVQKSINLKKSYGDNLWCLLIPFPLALYTAELICTIIDTLM